jgi:uncharacterized protein (DUF1778 family)
MTKAKLTSPITFGASAELHALVEQAANTAQMNLSSYARSALVRQLQLDGFSLRDMLTAAR